MISRKFTSSEYAALRWIGLRQPFFSISYLGFKLGSWNDRRVDAWDASKWDDFSMAWHLIDKCAAWLNRRYLVGRNHAMKAALRGRA